MLAILPILLLTTFYFGFMVFEKGEVHESVEPIIPMIPSQILPEVTLPELYSLTLHILHMMICYLFLNQALYIISRKPSTRTHCEK